MSAMNKDERPSKRPFIRVNFLLEPILVAQVDHVADEITRAAEERAAKVLGRMGGSASKKKPASVVRAATRTDAIRILLREAIEARYREQEQEQEQGGKRETAASASS